MFSIYLSLVSINAVLCGDGLKQFLLTLYETTKFSFQIVNDPYMFQNSYYFNLQTKVMSDITYCGHYILLNSAICE